MTGQPSRYWAPAPAQYPPNIEPQDNISHDIDQELAPPLLYSRPQVDYKQACLIDDKKKIGATVVSLLAAPSWNHHRVQQWNHLPRAAGETAFGAAMAGEGCRRDGDIRDRTWESAVQKQCFTN